MRLAFCLFKYFPYGGMQANFLAAASACSRRGHRVRVYVHRWQGDIPPAFEVVRVPERGVSSHARQRAYRAFVQDHLRTAPVDLVVGFNKMPGLDVYYAADNCEQAKHRGPGGALRRLLPRYRHLLDYERAIFAPGRGVRIMLVAVPQLAAYRNCYGTEAERFVLLPPGIRRDCAAGADSSRLRREVREELGLGAEDRLLLAIGSGFRAKGLARTLRALGRLPERLRRRCLLLVIGQDNFRPFARMVRRFGLTDAVRYLGARADIPRFLFAADLLVHPARNEASGMALLEAAAAGLPVLASGACGYAHYVSEFGFGRVLDEPFEQACYEELLRQMLSCSEAQAEQWREAGLGFARTAGIHDRAARIADFLETQVL